MFMIHSRPVSLSIAIAGSLLLATPACVDPGTGADDTIGESASELHRYRRRVLDDEGNCIDHCRRAWWVPQTPEGIALAFNYIAQEPFNVFDPTYQAPNAMLAPPQFPGFLIGAGYQSVVMERDPAAIAANLGDAIAFFADRFGVAPQDIEFEDPFGLSRPLTKPVRVAPFQVDPRTGASVHQMTGANLPDEGLPLLDGGWTFQVVAPSGYDGSMRSKIDPSTRRPVHYPPGTIFPFGDYKIVAVGDRVTRSGRPFAPRIHYQASEPILPDPNINFGRFLPKSWLHFAADAALQPIVGVNGLPTAFARTPAEELAGLPPLPPGASFIWSPAGSGIVRVDCELIADLGDGVLRHGEAVGTYKYTFDPLTGAWRTNLREILTIRDEVLDPSTTFVPRSVFGDLLSP